MPRDALTQARDFSGTGVSPVPLRRRFFVEAGEIHHLAAGALDAEMRDAVAIALHGDARLAGFIFRVGGRGRRAWRFEGLKIFLRFFLLARNHGDGKIAAAGQGGGGGERHESLGALRGHGAERASPGFSVAAILLMDSLSFISTVTRRLHSSVAAASAIGMVSANPETFAI